MPIKLDCFFRIYFDLLFVGGVAVAEFSSNICERFMKFLGIPLSSYFTPKVCLLLEQCFSVLDRRCNFHLQANFRGDQRKNAEKLYIVFLVFFLWSPNCEKKVV